MLKPWSQFCAWLLVGAALAFAVASLPSVGLLVLPLALVAAVAVGLLMRGQGWAGLATGAGAVLLWLASLHRNGPGMICSDGAAGSGCTTYLDPLPFLVGGVALVILGRVAHAFLPRIQKPSRRSASTAAPLPSGHEVASPHHGCRPL